MAHHFKGAFSSDLLYSEPKSSLRKMTQKA